MKRKLRSNHLGEAVRAAREEAGHTQPFLSQETGYEYNVVQAWESGAKPITAAEWERLCELLPALNASLGTIHAAELALGDGRKLKPRPSRLDSQVTRALNELVDTKTTGRNLTDVAAEMKLDYVGLWKMIKGSSNPTIAQIRVIAAYFQVDTDQVLGVRPIEAPSYTALLALVAKQSEELKNMERIRKLNDLLLEQNEK